MTFTRTLLCSLVALAASTAFAHSETFKPTFVDTLIAPYLAIQKGLAADDLKAAQTGAQKYVDAMKNSPTEKEVKAQTQKLSDPATTILNASDIKAARAAFLTLSKEVTSLVEHVGTTNQAKLYVAHCPMAFGNGRSAGCRSSARAIRARTESGSASSAANFFLRVTSRMKSRTWLRPAV